MQISSRRLELADIDSVLTTKRQELELLQQAATVIGVSLLPLVTTKRQELELLQQAATEIA